MNLISDSSVMSRKRVYKEEFLGTGFTCLIDHGTEKPQCVVCGEVLSHESLKENKLKRHLQGKHPALAGKDLEYFKRNEEQLKRQRLDKPMHTGVYSVQQATLASYLVAKRIAKCMQPHTIGEKLVKPAALDMVSTILGDAAAKKIQTIPLSDNTINRRIQEMSGDIKEQVVAAIKGSGKFSLQLDEFTDVSDDAQLLVYVRYQGKSDIEENFLFCKRLETTTTGEDLFKLVDNFIKEEGLKWDQCYSVCSDGAPAMLGARQGFTARVKQVNPTVIVTHCLLHRENLASRKMSLELNTVIEDVIQIVNFVKSSALNSRLFSQMCSDMGSEYEHLLYYSSVRWLSRGKVLQRLLDMRVEVEIFLHEKKHALAARLTEPRWLLKLAYLTDIFSELNSLNVSMQGKDETLISVSQKLKAFKAKLRLWKGKIELGKTASFPLMNLFLEDEEDASLLDVQSVIFGHLEKLIEEFDKYIPDGELHEKYKWLCRPFDVQAEDLSEEYSIQNLREELIEVQHDETLRFNFERQTLGVFWTAVKKEKPVLGCEAVKMLLPFATTYLCESGFAALTAIKTRYRNRLQPEHDLRVALSKTEPRIEKLSNMIQAQGSH